MHAPHESGHDDHQLTRYLLGLLPEEDTERLDELSITSDAVAHRLRTVEDDLVDGYVRGTLPMGTREHFEAAYLASPHRRRKVEFARGLLHEVDRLAAVEHVASTPARQPLPRSSLAAVAAIVVLLGGGAAVFGGLQLRGARQELEIQRALIERRAHTLEQQFEAQRQAVVESRHELERMRAALDALSERSQPEAAALPPTVALVLPPPTRSGGAGVTLAVSRAATVVAFELQLDANEFPKYEAALHGASGDRVLWRSRPLTVRAGSPPALAFTVPASLFGSQHYALSLTGQREGGAAQAVGTYGFRIVRR
jgi:hypothetical protein